MIDMRPAGVLIDASFHRSRRRGTSAAVFENRLMTLTEGTFDCFSSAEAEAIGLLRAIEALEQRSLTRARIHCDFKPLVDSIHGLQAVRKERFGRLIERIQARLERSPGIEVVWVGRKRLRRAHEAAGARMNRDLRTKGVPEPRSA